MLRSGSPGGPISGTAAVAAASLQAVVAALGKKEPGLVELIRGLCAVPARLAPHFAVRGHPAATAELSEAEANGLRVPEALLELWRSAREWHLIERHYHAFGLNLYMPKAGFGPDSLDEGVREILDEEWAEHVKVEHHSSSAPHTGSCADKGFGWCYLGCFSEFDHLFVCLGDNSWNGRVRAVTNNCGEESHVYGSVDGLLAGVLAFLVEAEALASWSGKRTANGGGFELELEELCEANLYAPPYAWDPDRSAGPALDCRLASLRASILSSILLTL